MKRFILLALLSIILSLTYTGTFAQVFTIGTGTNVSGQFDTDITPYGTFYHDGRDQYLILASELIAAGASAGQITSLAFDVFALNNPSETLNGFTIKIGNTAVTTLGNNFEPNTGFTTCFSSNVTINSTGWNTHIFTTPFIWNGTSNIIVEVCFNNAAYTDNVQVRYTSTLFNSNTNDFQDNATGCTLSFPTSSVDRPNMQLNILSAPCVAPPTAGTAVPSDSAVCPNSNVLVSLSGNTTGTGQTYQWQSSPDSSTWTNIVGATNASYNATITDTIYFRCIVTCSAQSDTSTSTVAVELNSFLSCYCQPTISFGCGIDYTSNVTFASINNSTGCNSGQLYTTPNPIIFKGTSQTLFVTTDGDDEGVSAWIDYNHNGIFEASEQVMSSPVNPPPYTHSSTFTIPISALSGTTRMRTLNQYNNTPLPTGACGTYSFGEVEDYYITLKPRPFNEASTQNIVTPSLTPGNCAIDTTISVAISTIGQLPLTSVTINYQVNSSPAQTYSWTGNLTNGQVDTVVIGTNTFNSGDTLTVWTANPNNVQDSATFNDTVAKVVYSSLNGVYTIGGTAPNYPTIQAALADAYVKGVCDTVFFDMRPGTYNDQDTLLPVPGASMLSPIIFRSENGIADSVRIQFNNSNFTANAVLTFDGGDWFGFENVTIQNVSTGSYRQVIFFNGNSENNWFMNCKIIGDTNTTSTSSNLVLVYSPSGTTNDNGTKFINNQFWGGSDAIFFFGDVADKEVGNVFRGNTINDPVRIGIALIYQKDVEISYNKILATESNNTNMFLLDLEIASGDIEIRNNFIINATGGFGINLVNVDASLNNRGVVANNYVLRGDTTGVGTYAEGISLQGCLFLDVVHNTVNIIADNAQAACLNMDVGNQGESAAIRVLNNNFKQSGTGYVLKVTDESNIGMANYNNLFTDSGKVAMVAGTDYNTLADVQTAFGWGANSVSVNPNFIIDYHTCRPELDNTAMPLAYVTNDLDEDQRYLASPDMGADEFITPAKFSIGPDIYKCVGDTVVLGAENIQSATYNWNTFDSTATISVSNVTTVAPPNLFYVVATTNCGIATDSIYVYDLPVAVAAFDTANNYFTFTFTNNSQNSISYFWDFGDGDTSNLTNPVHVYGAEGFYTVTLIATDSCGNSDTATMTIKVDIPGIAVKENLLANYGIYPNPSNGFFNIESTINEGGQAFVRVTDMAGRVIYRTSFIHPGGVYTKPIHLGNVRSGIYVVSIRVNDAIGMQKLIIK